jgi:uncharacterized alpha/beta hydrolase family protein
MNLSDVLAVGYKKEEEQQKYFSDNNYIRDNQLSNADNQAYFNKNENKLIFNVTGSHKIKDFLFTDPLLAFGGIKLTDRYKQSDKLLKEAKKKYQPEKTTVVGHSLGGSIAGLIGTGDDVFTLNKGSTIGSTIRTNEKAYRSGGDVISLLNSGSKRIKTLKNPNENYFKNGLLGQIYQAHNLKNIQNSNILI